MPIEVSWLDEADRSVVLIKYSERWTWQEWQEMVTRFIEMHGEPTNPFSIIADHRPTKHLPIGLLDAARVANDYAFFDEIHKIVLIGTPYMLNMLFVIFKRVYPQAAELYYFCDEFEEALAIIKQTE